MKRTEGELAKITNICYDNRINVLSYLSFDDFFRFGDGMVFKYNQGLEKVEYYGFYLKSLTFDGNHGNAPYLKKEYNDSIIFKLMYGYFQNDKMRRIYFLEYRICTRVRFDRGSRDGNLYTIRVKDILPYRCPRLHLLVDCRQSVPQNFSIALDYSKTSITDLTVELVNTKYRKDTLFTDIFKEKQNMKRCVFISRDLEIRSSDFHEFMRRSEFLQFRGVSKIIYDEDFRNLSNRRRSIYLKSPLCQRLGLKFPLLPCVHFSDDFFQSFSNLSRISIESISFRNVFERDNFFKNIRNYARNIAVTPIYEINTENENEGEECGNIIDIMCRDNKKLQILCIEFGSFITKNVGTLDFLNHTLSALLLENDRGTNHKYELATFQKLFQCLANVTRLGFSDMSSTPSTISGIPEIVAALPERIVALSLIFPLLWCGESLKNSILGLKDRLVRFSVAFSNITSLISDIFSFTKLQMFSVNDINHFPNTSTLIIPTYSLEKEHLRLFCQNMKQLKQLRFCFQCESMVYFLKYSERTQHIKRVTIDNRALGYPLQPFKDRATGKSTYLSDFLPFNEFERGVEYFEDKSSFQINPIRFRFYVERRKEMVRNLEKSEEQWYSQRLGYSESFLSPGSVNARDDPRKIFFQLFSSCVDRIGRNTGSESPGSNFTPNIKKKLKESYSFESSLSENIDSSDRNYEYNLSTTTTSPFKEDGGYIFKCFLRCGSSDFPFLQDRKREEAIMFDGRVLFSRKNENGVYRYQFISPSGLDFYRFCVSQPNNMDSSSKWISREDFVRLVCSMVGIDVRGGMKLNIFSENNRVRTTENEERFDMKWILREAQRIYSIKFEEMNDDDVDFVDCMFGN